MSSIQFLPSSIALMLQNRARFNTGFGTTKNNSIQRSPHLWPLVLKHASRAFKLPFRFKPLDQYYASVQEQQPDAIYRLLLIGRESFMDVLLDRQRENNVVSYPDR